VSLYIILKFEKPLKRRQQVERKKQRNQYEEKYKIKEIFIHLQCYVDKSDTSGCRKYGVSFTHTQNILYFVMAANSSVAFQTSLLL
jgi:hypothetical protein